MRVPYLKGEILNDFLGNPEFKGATYDAIAKAQISRCDAIAKAQRWPKHKAPLLKHLFQEAP